MSGRAQRSLVIAAGLVALTWPMAVAHILLRYVFLRPQVANGAAVYAYPASLLLAAAATAVSVRRPPTEPMSWVFRCTLLGGVIGDVWLAFGAYVHAYRELTALAGTLLGGLLYGTPVGLFFGAVLGLELSFLRSTAGEWRRTGVVLLCNVVLAGFLELLAAQVS